jgi:hypothetical protein
LGNVLSIPEPKKSQFVLLVQQPAFFERHKTR